MMTIQPVKRDLRVREKLLTFGAQNLSDVELLAVFISSGYAKKTCVQLAHDLLNHFGDMRTLLNADLATFQQIPGMGQVRYVQLQAVREICRRSDLISLQKNAQLTNTQETYAFLKRQLRDQKNETFVALFLDSQNRVLTYEELFTGTINMASIHPRPIIQRILKHNAAAVILAHNHPSGSSYASEQDIALTERMQHAFDLVDTQLLDHIVIGDNEVYSIMTATTWACH
jgi:DNA repair protein RadC